MNRIVVSILFFALSCSMQPTAVHSNRMVNTKDKLQHRTEFCGTRPWQAARSSRILRANFLLPVILWCCWLSCACIFFNVWNENLLNYNRQCLSLVRRLSFISFAVHFNESILNFERIAGMTGRTARAHTSSSSPSCRHTHNKITHHQQRVRRSSTEICTSKRL